MERRTLLLDGMRLPKPKVQLSYGLTVSGLRNKLINYFSIQSYLSAEAKASIIHDYDRFVTNGRDAEAVARKLILDWGNTSCEDEILLSNDY